MVKTELKVHIEKADIKQPGMNPWKKVLKRMIYTDGQRYFIKFKGFFNTLEINGQDYREVKKVGSCWFLE